MKKLFLYSVLFFGSLSVATVAAASVQQQTYPDSAKGVAVAFMTCYESGDPSTGNYVFYTSKHVPQMGGTPEELRDELLPSELRKNRKNPANAELLEITFSQADSSYGYDVWYAVYFAREKKHTICLHMIEGKWKVDLAYLWMGDWYDWMPGY